MNRRLLVTYTIIVYVVVASSVPAAKAQTTTIMNVEYPKSALFNIDTQTADPSLVVTATITFLDAKPGYFLEVGLFTLGRDEFAGGSAKAYPDRCLSGGGLAGCLIPIGVSQGAEDLEFNLVHPHRTWDLALVAGLLNQSGSMIYDSFSDYEFTIRVYTGLTLTVLVPESVTVNVDGANQSLGNIRLSLIAGPHNVSVPEIVAVNENTRLQFKGWSDGEGEPNRTVVLNRDVDLRADYVTQYWLLIASPQVNSTGAGWYDNDSTARFSVPSSQQPMSGWLGMLGGRWRFQGWYENQTLLTPFQNGTLTMNAPHAISARWDADYFLPAIIATSVGIIALAATRKHWNGLGPPRHRNATARRRSRPRVSRR